MKTLRFSNYSDTRLVELLESGVDSFKLFEYLFECFYSYSYYKLYLLWLLRHTVGRTTWIGGRQLQARSLEGNTLAARSRPTGWFSTRTKFVQMLETIILFGDQHYCFCTIIVSTQLFCTIILFGDQPYCFCTGSLTTVWCLGSQSITEALSNNLNNTKIQDSSVERSGNYPCDVICLVSRESFCSPRLSATTKK